MNLQIVYQYILIFSSNKRFKKQMFFISSTVTDITNLLYKKLTFYQETIL